jgi:hypothetical protein
MDALNASILLDCVVLVVLLVVRSASANVHKDRRVREMGSTGINVMMKANLNLARVIGNKAHNKI